MKFKKGDRVRVSSKGVRYGLRQGTTVEGTVFIQTSDTAQVIWDGTKKPVSVHQTLLTWMRPTHEICPRCETHQKTWEAQLCGNCYIEVGGSKGQFYKREK